MKADHSEEQLNCAIEASSYVLKPLDRNAGLSEEKIREALVVARYVVSYHNKSLT